MKALLRMIVLHKTCPHCGGVNHLSIIDLIRSFYLRTPADNHAARHWCHYCHKGWDVAWFFSCTLLVYLPTAYLLLRMMSSNLAMNTRFADFPDVPSFLFIGLKLLLAAVFLVVCDFAFKSVLVKLLRLKKQI
jgi:hypothetical protein